MRNIKEKILLFIMLLMVISCSSCAASSPTSISSKTNDEGENLAIYFRVLDNSGKALKTPGSVKITITGDGYRINEQPSNSEIRYTQTKHADNVADFTYALDTEPFVFEKDFSLAESDYTQFSFPGYTYITQKEEEDAKRGINDDPWGYKLSIPVTEIQPIYLEYASKYSDYPSLVTELTNSVFLEDVNVEIVFTTTNGIVIKGTLN